LCALFILRSGAAPNDDARKIKLAEGLRAKEAKARAAGLASATRDQSPAFAADGGYEKAWEQSSWGTPVQKQWDGKNSYWEKTDAVDLAFMDPWIAPASSWAARRDLPMTTASRFAVSSAAGRTCILCGGVGTGSYADSGVVYYAEDREGAHWEVSGVREGGGFTAKGVFDLCWAPKSTSGYICAATSMQNVSTPKTPLFYYPGPVPTSDWTSASEAGSIPRRSIYEFSAIAPAPASASAEVYLGFAKGSAEVYRFREPNDWEWLGNAALPGEAKGVYSLCVVDTGVLAGTEPKGSVYEWVKSQKKWEERRLGQLTGGVVYDLAKVGDYVYAALGNCSPEPEARLFRAKDDYARWEDVTPKGSAAAALKAFVAVDAFGKDGAVGALGDSFDQVFVARAPGPAGWGLVKGDGGSGKDLVHATAGTDFWGNFVACEKDGVYARKFQGFKSDGVLYSSVFDSRDKLVEYKKLEFEGALASGGARFWLRAAQNYDALETPQGWRTGEPSWVEVSPGQPLPVELNGKRYVQYKVQLDVPDGQKFPPVVKKVRVVTYQTYGKVTGTSPVNSATNQKIDAPVKFVFSKDINDETITRDNLKIKGKDGEEYAWWRVQYDPDKCEYVADHEKFKSYDEVTVVLESIKDREILDYWGEEIDPDGDGEPGGMYKFSFKVGKDGGGETEGPKVYDVVVEPNPTYGAKEVKITATADDTETGRSNVVAAEYSFGRNPAPAGEGEPMEGDFGHEPKIEVWATADIGGLVQGEERLMVYVRAKDMAGNWGDPTAAPIFVRPPEFLPKEYVYFYPNPCRGDTGYFHYLVTKKSDVKVRVYDMRGRLVNEIEAEVEPFSGESLRWDVSDVGADVYVFRLTARSRTDGEEASVTKKLAVLK